MMPASKHGDPQLGIDIHLCVVPPSPSPVPLPTPHTSIVFDPFDYVPILGATVTVCGMKRATAGTNATAIHIPPGFPFAPKLPDKDDEIFMGSSTVVADGDPFSFTSVPTLSCQIVGMFSPPRLKKKGPPKAMLLPTTVNLAIPTNVFVGGPPTISLMGMAFKGAFSALGRFARSGIFRRIRQRLFKNLNPGVLKCSILRAEPVNILSGEVSVEHEDFTLPGRIPIEWRRTYSSGSIRNGLCGYGWETPADIRLEVDGSNGSVFMILPDGGPLFFERLPVAGEDEAPELELMDGALLSRYGDEFCVRTKEDRIYHFSRGLGFQNASGVIEYPVTRIKDLCGNWLEFERRGGELVCIKESAGRRIEFMKENNRIVEVALSLPQTEERHVFVQYQYDPAGNLMSVIDALGSPYTFAYDSHLMVRHTDRNGLSFYYDYDESSKGEWRVVHAWGDGGLYDYTFEYFDELNERRITDSLGHTSLVKLNEAGLPISEIDPLGGMMIFEYDDRGRTSAVVDQDGNRTEYDYDESGNLLKLTHPDGYSLQTEFDKTNKAVKIIDNNDAHWQQKWDPRGLVIEQVTPLGHYSHYEYDKHGQIIASIDPRGFRTTFSFDWVGNLSSIKDALKHRTLLTYDILGNITSMLNPLGNKTRYRFDAKSRLTEVIFPSNAFILCAYDAEDNITLYVDENGAKTEFEYFGQGEMARCIQSDNYSIRYDYDTEERLICVTDQCGKTYHLKRDALGRIIQEVDYWGQAKSYNYSACGHIEQSEDPKGQIIVYETDALGRIVKKTLLYTQGVDMPVEESFDYDSNGNLVACTNPNICIECEFDLERRMVMEKQGANFVIHYKYDEVSNCIGRQTELIQGKDTFGHLISYSYDALDQVTDITIDNNPPIMIERDAVGQIVAEQLSPMLRRKIEYSVDGYLLHQSVEVETKRIVEVAYAYAADGNLTEKRDAEFGTDKFTYAPVGRITQHLDPVGKLKAYVNDPSGNRLLTRVFEGAPSKAADGVDKDIHSQWSRDGQYRGVNYRFDRTGNLIERHDERGKLILKWDANQRMVESQMNGKSTWYRYDSLGRRIDKRSAEAYSMYFWDGDSLVGENFTTTRGKDGVLREWVYFPETHAPMVMLGGSNPQSVLHYHNDPNGCPTRLSDGKGVVKWAASHNVWGAIEYFHLKTVDNPIRLQGQYYDEESDLHYNRYRYYVPAISAFASQDPLGLFPGVNLYEYAVNTMGWIDPLGLKGCNILKSTKKALGAAPAGMNYAHMHHIVMEGAFTGWTRANRKLVTQARTILRNHNINIQGINNVIWAVNEGHSVDYARNVLVRLQRANPKGREAVIRSLNRIGRDIARGTF